MRTQRLFPILVAGAAVGLILQGALSFIWRDAYLSIRLLWVVGTAVVSFLLIDAGIGCVRGVLRGGFVAAYPGLLHGGVTALLLDGAMTNCLFAHDKAAVTGELAIKYLEPVTLERFAFVKAWISYSFAPLHVVEAELHQGGKVLARATGKFMERPSDPTDGS